MPSDETRTLPRYVFAKQRGGREVFQTWYRGPDGRRVTTYKDEKGRPFKSPEEAAQWRERQLDAIAQGGDLATQAAERAQAQERAAKGSQPFAEYARQWNERRAATRLASGRNRPQTVEQRRHLLRHVEESWLGEKRLNAVTTDDVADFQIALLGKLSNSTVAQVMRLVRGALDAAVKARVITFNPADAESVEPVNPKLRAKAKPVGTPEEVEALAEAIGPQYAALVRLAARTGLRLGELTGLSADQFTYQGEAIDVALDRHGIEGLIGGGELRVSQALVQRGGRIRDGRGNLYLDAPKTSNSERVLPVPESVVRLIAEHVQAHGLAESRLIFGNREGRAIQRSSLYRVWRPAVAKIEGLADDFMPHSIRHSVRGWLAAQGTALEVTGLIFGHSASTMVAEAGLAPGLVTTLGYGNSSVLAEQKAAALEKLADRLDAARLAVVAEARGAEADEAAKAA